MASPWIKTPCMLSPPLSKIAGCNVWLKLENVQPSGSFKSRGVGNLMRKAAMAHGTSPPGHGVRYYSSSGGNAGLACACAAISLGSACTIAVPETTAPMMLAKLRALGATVVQTGRSWIEADAHLRSVLLANDPGGVYVPPFDHPDIWEGVSTLVDEVAEQLAGADVHAVVCAVGGGGLLNGIVQGVERHGRPACAPAVVVAVETEGADSLNASVRAGSHVTLPAITSIATSLGATRVSDRTWEYASRRHRQHHHPSVLSVVVGDDDAARAVVRFLDDTRLLVEVACGAALAAVYGPVGLRERLGAGLSDDEWAARNVVVVVCGGSAVSLDVVWGYRQALF